MEHDGECAAEDSCGLRGWMDGVAHIPAIEQDYPDVPAGAMVALAQMQHIMQGYQSTMIAWARSPANDGRSVHFSYGRDGEAIQHVSIFAAAWHAGRRDAVPPTWPLYDGRNPNKVTVGHEVEGFSRDPEDYPYDYIYTPSRPWPEPMVLSLIRVQRWVFEQTGIEPSTLTLIGHNETAPMSRAHDPGPMWPQERILAALAPPAEHVPLQMEDIRLRRAVDAAAKTYRSVMEDDGV